MVSKATELAKRIIIVAIESWKERACGICGSTKRLHLDLDSSAVYCEKCVYLEADKKYGGKE